MSAANLELHPAPTRSRLRAGPAPGEASTGFDSAYWLEHCEGYRVDGPSGRLGFVEAVRPVGRNGGPALLVRAGRFGEHLLHISVDEVAMIVPRAERIWLSSSASVDEH